MATYQTFQAVGEREDLTDVIYDISPTDTPFMSTVAKTNACLLYTSPSPRDRQKSRMPSSA